MGFIGPTYKYKYNKPVIELIAGRVGRLIRLDDATEMLARSRFMRVLPSMSTSPLH